MHTKTSFSIDWSIVYGITISVCNICSRIGSLALIFNQFSFSKISIGRYDSIRYEQLFMQRSIRCRSLCVTSRKESNGCVIHCINECTHRLIIFWIFQFPDKLTAHIRNKTPCILASQILKDLDKVKDKNFINVSLK